MDCLLLGVGGFFRAIPKLKKLVKLEARETGLSAAILDANLRKRPAVGVDVFGVEIFGEEVLDAV